MTPELAIYNLMTVMRVEKGTVSEPHPSQSITVDSPDILVRVSQYGAVHR